MVSWPFPPRPPAGWLSRPSCASHKSAPAALGVRQGEHRVWALDGHLSEGPDRLRPSPLLSIWPAAGCGSPDSTVYSRGHVQPEGSTNCETCEVHDVRGVNEMNAVARWLSSQKVINDRQP